MKVHLMDFVKLNIPQTYILYILLGLMSPSYIFTRYMKRKETEVIKNNYIHYLYRPPNPKLRLYNNISTAYY